MPLAKVEKLNGNSAWSLWEINENESELLNTLPAYDQDEFHRLNISHSGRRLEWLAARNNLQELAGNLSIAYEGITKDEHGKPQLKDHPFHIGITHSFPYAAGVIHKSKAVGIDIEAVQQKLLKLGPRFLNESELEDTGSKLEKLCVYWAAKETLYKIHGKRKLVFKENLYVEPFELLERGVLKGHINQSKTKKSHRILYIKINSFYISIGI